jgi:hypothetical protein
MVLLTPIKNIERLFDSLPLIIWLVWQEGRMLLTLSIPTHNYSSIYIFQFPYNIASINS